MLERKDQRSLILWIIMGIVLFALIVTMIITANQIQGNAKVINYAGVVRGATQKLVKNELYGVKDDKAIKRLDGIIYDLRTGKGNFSLAVINDKKYLKNLNEQNDYWKKLKKQILIARDEPAQRDRLYQYSEEYFKFADKTVLAAETYSEGLAKRIRILEIVIICLLTGILTFLIWTTTKIIHKNKLLDSITYIDYNTGLPNKRRCEDKLQEVNSLIERQNVCCFMFDLNNLKMINDTMGHQWGDFLILSFASFLRQVSPSSMFIGRFGGDEFIGIYENATREEIEQFLENLDKKAATLNYSADDKIIPISFAYGYAYSFDYPNCSTQILMDIADKNMYEDKRRKKGLAN